MKKLLFLTLLSLSVNTCLPAETSAPTDAKKLQEEANKKWQDEDNKLKKQIFQNKVNQLRKCAKESKNNDDQADCVIAVGAIREMLLNSKLEISDPKAIDQLKHFLEDGSKPGTKKLHHAFQDIDIKEIV